MARRVKTNMVTWKVIIWQDIFREKEDWRRNLRLYILECERRRRGWWKMIVGYGFNIRTGILGFLLGG
jgi:hypothetical protein